MKKGLIVGVLVLIMNQVSAAELGTENCDALYAKRGSESLRAFECYSQVVSTQTNQDLQKQVFDRMFVALSAVVNDLPKTSYERVAIDLGLNLVLKFHETFGGTAEYYYWKACFVSFDVIEKDRGSVIPTNMFGVLGDLQSYLQTAIKLDASVHFYGPMRVLGMMHTQMPLIVGGDKTLAQKLLKESYLKAPVFSSNHLAYAKILDINGKTSEAIRVLNQFLATSDESMNPYPDQPFLSLLPETLKDKKEAQKLLNDINE